jgi:AAA domain
LAPKVEVSDLARDQPPAASAATEVFDFEQALARLETKLQKAAPGDRLAIFRADAREVFWPVRMSVGAILTHIYGLANKYNLSGPDFIDQPAIDEIVEEITRLETEQRADEPIEDGDDVLERGPDDQSVRLVRGDSLSGKKAPPRKWVVENFVPDRTVTLGGGDGGVGKSQIALHMGVNVSLGRPWLDLRTERGPVLYLTAEDELDEVHRRLEDICAYERVDLKDLSDLHILPLAGQDALLAVPDRVRGTVRPTRLFERIKDELIIIKPKLTIFDTLADIFSGEENQRSHARSFVGLLRGLSLQFNMATLVLSHPSLGGLQSGSGTSGSTGWSNSVRSLLRGAAKERWQRGAGL